MIRGLRRWHWRWFLLLAIALPLLFALALWQRQPAATGDIPSLDATSSTPPSAQESSAP